MANAVLDVVTTTMTEATNQANAVATRIGAATTDRTKMVHDVLNDDSVTDEKVVKFREWREKALQAIEAAENEAREYVTANLLPGTEEVDVPTLTAEYKELASAVRAARTLLDKLPGVSAEDIKAALANVPDLKTLRGSTAGKGSGGKRPRVQRLSYRASTNDPWTEALSTRKDKDGNEVAFTNFTVLAQALTKVYDTKVEVKDLQTAAFEAAGTDDLNSLDGKVFEFAISVGDSTVFVQCQPKSDSDE
jgi:hypothetical protein